MVVFEIPWMGVKSLCSKLLILPISVLHLELTNAEKASSSHLLHTLQSCDVGLGTLGLVCLINMQLRTYSVLY